jgi:hypothetical protein
MWAAANQAATCFFRPSRGPADPPAGTPRARATDRPVTPVGRHLTPFFFLFFPFLPSPLSVAGAAVERPAVRPWLPPWMPSTRPGAASAVRPTYHRYKEPLREPRPRTLASWGFSSLIRRR